MDEDINRRPYNGWRSRYGINYKLATGELKTGTPNSLDGKYFYIKDHPDPSDYPVPDEGGTPKV